MYTAQPAGLQLPVSQRLILANRGAEPQRPRRAGRTVPDDEGNLFPRSIPVNDRQVLLCRRRQSQTKPPGAFTAIEESTIFQLIDTKSRRRQLHRHDYRVV
jgi:hypothetical protein